MDPPATGEGTARELRSRTLAQNERDGRNHLLPAFDRARLAEITVADVERFGDRLSASGLSNDTVVRVMNTLGAAMKLALKYRLVPYNPVSDAEKPRPRRRRPDLPTLAQLDRLADATPTRTTRALVRVATRTGI